MRRIFFALWPSPAWCAELAESVAPLLHSVAGRTSPQPELHVTLCFLGAVDEAALAPLCAACERIEAAAFDLTFDSIEYWRRARALVTTATMAPPQAIALIESIQSVVSAQALRFDAKPWRPHLTLARSVRARTLPDPACGPWRLPRAGVLSVDRFHLTESRRSEERRYQSLTSWPLVSAANTGA